MGVDRPDELRQSVGGTPDRWFPGRPSSWWHELFAISDSLRELECLRARRSGSIEPGLTWIGSSGCISLEVCNRISCVITSERRVRGL